jgi:YVTN family beta-propeller protein
LALTCCSMGSAGGLLSGPVTTLHAPESLLPSSPELSSVGYRSLNVSLGPTGSDPESEVFDPSTGEVYVMFGAADDPPGPSHLDIVSSSRYAVPKNVTLGSFDGSFTDYLPGGLAFDSTTGAVLVARGPDEVTALSGTTGSVITNVTVGQGPTTIAFDPHANEIFVANLDSNNLTVLNGSDYRVLASVPSGFPYSATFDPRTDEIDVIGEAGLSGHWYAAGLYDSNDSFAWSVWPALSLALPPSSFAMDPESDTLYVPTSADQVQVLNATDGASIGTVPVGFAPTSATYCAQTDMVFVANSGSDNVTLINTTDGATRSVSAGGYPQQVACTGPSVFVSNEDADTLSVLNSSTGGLVTTVSLGSAPWGVTYVPGHNLVLAAGGESLHALSTISDSVVANQTVGQNPQSIAFDPATGAAYVANVDSGSLSIVSPSPLRLISTSLVGDSPTGVAYDNATGELVVAVAGSDEVDVLSPSNGSKVFSTPVGGFPDGVLFDPDGNELYVTNYDTDNISVLSATTYAVEKTITLPFGSAPAWPALDPLNGRLFVPDRDSGNVTVISTSTLSVSAEIPTGGTPFQAAYDVQTDLVYVTNPVGGNITVIDPDSDHAGLSLPAAELPLGIAVGGPNGTLYVANEMSDIVEVITPEILSTSSSATLGDISMEVLALSLGVGIATAVVMRGRRRRSAARSMGPSP